MRNLLKRAARLALHECGGLAAIRYSRRKQFGIMMFHSFRESDEKNLDGLCGYVARHFEPVSLDLIARCLQEGGALPDRAVTVTVDDGYRDFLMHGHPFFRRHRIPATVYAVADFAARNLWLWTDKIEFALAHTARTVLRVDIGGERCEFPLGSDSGKERAFVDITERLKEVPNNKRVEFVSKLGEISEVEIPAAPPARRASMNFEELRFVASEGVEVGCHTASHPILSRIVDGAEMRREIAGARETLERGLGFPVRHFCYPNGFDRDIGETAVKCVREAGFTSGVTCNSGLNPVTADPLRLRRLPFDPSTPIPYGAELLAGLHATHRPEKQ